MTKLSCACREYIFRPDRFSVVLTWIHDEHVAKKLGAICGGKPSFPIPDKEKETFLNHLTLNYDDRKRRVQYCIGQCPSCGRLVLDFFGSDSDVFFSLVDMPANDGLEAELSAHDHSRPLYSGLGVCRCGVGYSENASGLMLSETGFDQYFREIKDTLLIPPPSPIDISMLSSEIVSLSRRLAFGIISTCMFCQEVRVVSKDERLIVSGLYRRDNQPLSGDTIP